jgi:hypothetical protein
MIEVDTRGSSWIRGPRLAFVAASGDDEIHLGWSNIEFDDGSKEAPLYDGLMVSTYNAADVLAGELSFFSHGETDTLGTPGEAADFIAVDDYFIWARNFAGDAGRILQIDGYDRVNENLASLGWQQDGLKTLFEDLEMGFSVSQNITAVGCSARGGGLEATTLNISVLMDEDVDSAIHDFEPNEIFEECVYNEGGFGGYLFYLAPPDEEIYLEYWLFSYFEPIQTYGLDYYATYPGNYELLDTEVSYEHGYWAWVLSNDVADDSPFIWVQGYWLDDPGDPAESWESVTIYPVEAIIEMDTALAPDGKVILCGVSETGQAYLFAADPLSRQAGGQWTLDSGGRTIEDCAVAVTDDNVAAVSLREGDDLLLGFVALP